MVPVTNSTTQGTGFALRIKMPSLEEEWKPLCKNLNTYSKVFFLAQIPIKLFLINLCWIYSLLIFPTSALGEGESLHNLLCHHFRDNI